MEVSLASLGAAMEFIFSLEKISRFSKYQDLAGLNQKDSAQLRKVINYQHKKANTSRATYDLTASVLKRVAELFDCERLPILHPKKRTDRAKKPPDKPASKSKSTFDEPSAKKSKEKSEPHPHDQREQVSRDGDPEIFRTMPEGQSRPPHVAITIPDPNATLTEELQKAAIDKPWPHIAD